MREKTFRRSPVWISAPDDDVEGSPAAVQCYSCWENLCIFTFFLPESDSWMIAISSETARERAQSENGHLLNLRLQEVTINAAHTIRDSFKPAWFA